MLFRVYVCIFKECMALGKLVSIFILLCCSIIAGSWNQGVCVVLKKVFPVHNAPTQWGLVKGQICSVVSIKKNWYRGALCSDKTNICNL
uniref:Uncharacterized protein n=1 Tax=Rhizophora mucronata TaxID=61149 RepID=A0A2P2QVI2_RHIMU